jgi:pSer/pThr/pTyr-binding forkhead associated (FHA) protein
MGDLATDPFLQACGASRPLDLEIESAAEAGKWCSRILPYPFAVVGRSPGADIVLRHAEVGRRHAYLQLIAGRVFWVDLASRSGVRVRGEVRQSGWLDHEVPLQIGPYQIRARKGAFPGVSWPARADGSDPWGEWPSLNLPLSRVVFRVRNTMERRSHWRMKERLSLVGRAADCHPTLSDPSVSLFHCSLVLTPTGLWVVDLASRLGTKVNGNAVRYARLSDGDELQVGRFRLLLDDGTTSDPVHRAEPGGVGVPSLLPPTSFQPPALPEESVLRDLIATLEPSGRTDHARSTERNELARSVLVPLVLQMGRMQEQMTAQSNQVMRMLEMFGVIQRDQRALLEQERGEIDRLSTELRALQAELGRRFSALKGPVPTANPGGVTRDPVVPGRPRRAASPQGAASDPSPSRPDPRQVMGYETPPTDGDARPQPAPMSRQDADQPQGQTDARIHAVLCQRIAEIQNERQSRWQKVLSIVVGN